VAASSASTSLGEQKSPQTEGHLHVHHTSAYRIKAEGKKLILHHLSPIQFPGKHSFDGAACVLDAGRLWLFTIDNWSLIPPPCSCQLRTENKLEAT